MKEKLPFLIALFGMVLGVFIAILFGINEGIFKDRIKADLKKNAKISAITDPEKKAKKLEKEASKNWRYYQRFHFHSTGIGAMSLGILLLIHFLSAPCRLKLTASYLTSVGGFLYPFVWLFAGIYGPTMGRSEAKEAFAFFAYMGAVFLIGLLLTTFLTAKYALPKKD